MSDLKEAILKAKGKKENAKPVMVHKKKQNTKTDVVHQKKEEKKENGINAIDSQSVKGIEEQLKQKWRDMLQELKSWLGSKPEDLFQKKKETIPAKEEIPIVVYPDEEEPVQQVEIHPTICLAMPFGQPRGVLIYEGTGEYKDFELEKDVCLIGKSHRARMQIERETISQFHAKVDYSDGNYYIEDLNSTNGTFVNDEILNYKEHKLLHSGDMLRFADVKYRFL